VAIHAYRMAARAVFFLPPPKVFVASQPKTGSHLLNGLLKRLPKMMFSGVHFSPDDFVYVPTTHAIRLARGRSETDWDRLKKALDKIQNGHFMTAHWPSKPRLHEALEELGFRSIFLLRDPRDTVVSHSFFAKNSAATYLHYRYSNVLKTDEERITASITGFPSDEHGRGQYPLSRRLQQYLPWMEAPNTHICRFEALVGEAGGGTSRTQLDEIMSVARHVGRPIDREKAAQISVQIWSPKSFTFRQGTIGDWRNHFTDEHKEAFKREAGEYLIKLGYESTPNW
jgi:hypothetical protein